MKKNTKSLQVPDKLMQEKKDAAGAGLVFHDPSKAPFEVSGLAWFQEDGLWRRLPKAFAIQGNPALEKTAWQCAGGRIRFQSDTHRVWLRVKLSAGLAPVLGMPATGSQGLDLYVGKPGKEEFFYVTMTTAAEYEFELYKDAENLGMQDFLIHLPLFAGIEKLSIGIDENAKLAAPTPYLEPEHPIVVYGSGITQGRCAARPGMAWPAQLARKTRRSVLNFGFDEASHGEPEMAELLARLDPCVYILDYEADSPKTFIPTLAAFIDTLRDAHPETPIAVMTATRTISNDAAAAKLGLRNRAYARSLVGMRHLRSDLKLYLVEGYDLLDPVWEDCTPDGTHLNDLGFNRIANAMLPRITQYLKTHFRTGLAPL